MVRLRRTLRDLVTLSLTWLAACASVESSKGPDTLAPTVSVDHSLAAPVAGPQQALGFELSSRVNQPQCLDVPGDEREARKCICAWGATCLCRVKVKPRGDSSCLVQSMTEFEEGYPKVRDWDGGTQEGFTIVERMGWPAGSVLALGDSTSVCGLTITCLSER
jgi:hypothetical protein